VNGRLNGRKNSLKVPGDRYARPQLPRIFFIFLRDENLNVTVDGFHQALSWEGYDKLGAFGFQQI